jgi:predicted helicase
MFNCVSLEDLLKEFGKANQDPFIHFYETFLGEYDPKLRKSRGVYYTPTAVVRFIVQAADDALIHDFGISQGLADYSKILVPVLQKDGSKKETPVHKVQILDPATGTGTFLAEVIDRIYSKFAGQKGLWSSYCGEQLIPRLNGFEILMASYTMAHFKLAMKLKETGYSGNFDERLRVFLTNTLEEPKDDAPQFFMEKWLTDEAKAANIIKRDTPVMVVLGNPPYSVSSQNNSDWITSLIADYKSGMNERNIQPLSDDYIKFIRYGQHLVKKNETGILAYISNNSFIDGLIHRKMRESLLQDFDTIYILDLHGNSKKKETAPDGGKDENVFDIQQGVSINIFIKTGKKKGGELARALHFDLYGKRESKRQFLSENTLATVKWQNLLPETPHFFFVPKDFNNQAEYEKGFSVAELFQVYTSGIKTHHDEELVSFNQFSENTQKYSYRPFDTRYINYDLKKIVRHRYEVMKHILNKENLCLCTCRQQSTFNFQHILISRNLSDMCFVSSQTKETTYAFPLYLYPEKDTLDADEKRRPNLNNKIVDEIAVKIGLRFTEKKEDNPDTFAPIDLLDYIYAVLHSPAYREKYREFLKIDFPRVPYPENAGRFFALAALGETLRKIHLLEGVEPSQKMGLFPVDGSHEVEKAEYKDGQIWINKTQYFDAVPPVVWNFYIGGYQPAQKWLKDRKGRGLNFEQIQHYKRILAALRLTGELLAQVDEAFIPFLGTTR